MHEARLHPFTACSPNAHELVNKAAGVRYQVEVKSYLALVTSFLLTLEKFGLVDCVGFILAWEGFLSVMSRTATTRNNNVGPYFLTIEGVSYQSSNRVF